MKTNVPPHWKMLSGKSKKLNSTKVFIAVGSTWLIVIFWLFFKQHNGLEACRNDPNSDAALPLVYTFVGISKLNCKYSMIQKQILLVMYLKKLYKFYLKGVMMKLKFYFGTDQLGTVRSIPIFLISRVRAWFSHKTNTSKRSQR